MTILITSRVWSVDDESIATIDQSGNLFPKKEGWVVVSLLINGKYKRDKRVFVKAPPVVTVENITTQQGKAGKLTYSLDVPVDPKLIKSVKWVSTKPEVLKVEEDGTFTTLGKEGSWGDVPVYVLINNAWRGDAIVTVKQLTITLTSHNEPNLGESGVFKFNTDVLEIESVNGKPYTITSANPEVLYFGKGDESNVFFTKSVGVTNIELSLKSTDGVVFKPKFNIIVNGPVTITLPTKTDYIVTDGPFKYEVVYPDWVANNPITWLSSNESVFTTNQVNSEIRPVGVGSADFTFILKTEYEVYRSKVTLNMVIPKMTLSLTKQFMVTDEETILTVKVDPPTVSFHDLKVIPSITDSKVVLKKIDDLNYSLKTTEGVDFDVEVIGNDIYIEKVSISTVKPVISLPKHLYAGEVERVIVNLTKFNDAIGELLDLDTENKYVRDTVWTIQGSGVSVDNKGFVKSPAASSFRLEGLFNKIYKTKTETLEFKPTPKITIRTGSKTLAQGDIRIFNATIEGYHEEPVFTWTSDDESKFHFVDNVGKTRNDKGATGTIRVTVKLRNWQALELISINENFLRYTTVGAIHVNEVDRPDFSLRRAMTSTSTMESSNEKILTTDGNKITAVGKGKVNLLFKITTPNGEAFTETQELNVGPAVAISLGFQQQHYIGDPDFGAELKTLEPGVLIENIYFESSSPGVAIVAGTAGMISIVSIGTTTITGTVTTRLGIYHTDRLLTISDFAVIVGVSDVLAGIDEVVDINISTVPIDYVPGTIDVNIDKPELATLTRITLTKYKLVPKAVGDVIITSLIDGRFTGTEVVSFYKLTIPQPDPIYVPIKTKLSYCLVVTEGTDLDTCEYTG